MALSVTSVAVVFSFQQKTLMRMAFPGTQNDNLVRLSLVLDGKIFRADPVVELGGCQVSGVSFLISIIFLRRVLRDESRGFERLRWDDEVTNGERERER